MTLLESLIFGITQGLTEFLPVSSSGHIELGKFLFNIDLESSGILFTLILHLGTTLSIIVIYYKDIFKIFRSIFSLKKDKKYALYLIVSAIPVGLVGLLFEKEITQLFDGNLILLGFSFLFTSIFLFTQSFIEKSSESVNFKKSLIIGLAQAFAIFPGVSRSGATISTALMLKVDKEKAAKFSFLMVILPVVGASFYKLLQNGEELTNQEISVSSLIIGFIASFITGLIAIKFMISLIKKQKLYIFGIYTFILAIFCIFMGL